MMRLTTWPEPTEEKSVINVQWKTGDRHGGTVRVKVCRSYQDPALIAELSAIRYLLFERCVFNVLPMNGRGYCLIVSTGAIRKLMLGKSSKREALPFSTFLKTRMQGIIIKVITQKPSFEVTEPDPNMAMIDAEAEQDTLAFEAIKTPGIGTVYLTDHAVQRYVERVVGDEARAPWKSLAKRLQHPGLRPLPIPKRHIEHKQRKYGQDNQVEAWSHPTSTLAYLVVQEGMKRTVVTVFRREPGNF